MPPATSRPLSDDSFVHRTRNEFRKSVSVASVEPGSPRDHNDREYKNVIFRESGGGNRFLPRARPPQYRWLSPREQQASFAQIASTDWFVVVVARLSRPRVDRSMECAT